MKRQPKQKTTVPPTPLRLEWRSPAELTQNPRNWRTHPESQQKALAGILSEVGWAGACLFNERTGLLIDGHLRQKVAIANGADKVPVLVGDWSPEQEAKILATLDPIAGLAGADPVKLDALLKEVDTGCAEVQQMLADLWEEAQADAIADTEPADPVDAEPQTDRAAELQEHWGTAAGQLWLLGKHRLLCGDSTKPEDVARVMGGEKADCVLTDPPYGIGADKAMSEKGGQQYGKAAAPKRHYAATDWDHAPSNEVMSAIAVAAEQVVIWGGNFFDLPPSRCWLVWDKENGGNAFADCELAWTSLDKPVRLKRHMWNGMIRKDGEDRNAHPTQKPLAVMMWCLEMMAGETVLDFYLGSGTTLIAAENLGRRCFGLEISPAYCAVILQRYADAFPDQEIRQA